jgi:hypothetical protein
VLGEQAGMKLNMGCGLNKQPGWVNVDLSTRSEPDVVADLEVTPWPWPDDSAEEVLFNHSLEHMGQTPKVFLAVMAELYRVCAPGAVVRVNAPHPRHDHFLNDPTHVRPITPETLQLFDRRLNLDWQARGGANTPLSLYLDVDFELTVRAALLDEPYARQLSRGELTREAAHELASTRNNVVREYRLEMTVHKPPRTASAAG